MVRSADYGNRLDLARRTMAEADVDALLLSVGADLPYLTGYEAPQSERLTMLVLPRVGEATLLVPRLEAPRVTQRGEAFTVAAWEETENPVTKVAALVGGATTRIAIGDPTWSRFLLALQSELPGSVFLPAAPLISRLRVQKDAEEVDHLRRAGEAADRVVAALDAEVFSGRSERDLAGRVSELTVAKGHDVASFAIVGSGPNAASPHHEPSDRIIERGDAVVIDFGGRVAGYCSDTTRTFHVGDPAPPFVETYSVLKEAQAAAVEKVAPGVPAQEVDRVARRLIDAAGYGDSFVHRTGHGIGLEVHEEPYIVEGNDRLLEPGMTFSVEPGIYLPGEYGMRIEDIVVVTETGVERLNTSPRRLHLVD